MEFLAEIATWFADPARWSGSDAIPRRLVEHVGLAVLPTVIAAAAAVAPAVVLAHRRRGRVVVGIIANLGRAVPSFGILILAAFVFASAGMSLRTGPAVVALVLLALPPIFTNSYAGIASVPPPVVEAGRGMGLREGQLLLRVELPLAAPVVLAGVETAFVQVLATVPLAAVVSSGGGLGRYIVRGFALGPAGRSEVLAGAVLVALLTVGLQRVIVVAGRRILSRGSPRAEPSGAERESPILL